MKMTPIMRTAMLLIMLVLHILDYAAELSPDERDNKIVGYLRLALEAMQDISDNPEVHMTHND